jgi:hypothetical protein
MTSLLRLTLSRPWSQQLLYTTQEINLRDLLPTLNIDLNLDLRLPSLPKITLPKLPRVSLNLDRLLRQLKIGLQKLFQLFKVDLGDIFSWLDINLGDLWVSTNELVLFDGWQLLC